MAIFDLSNVNRKYDDMAYESRPVKYSEFISDKYNHVHRQMYEDALNTLIKHIIKVENIENKNGEPMSVNEYKRLHRCVEIKNDEYWKPSKVTIIEKSFPHSKHVYDLTGFWNYHQSKTDKSVKELKMNDDIHDWEIIKIDYIKGCVTLYSRVEDVETIVDFDYVDKNMVLSDELSLKNTISAKINNNY